MLKTEDGMGLLWYSRKKIGDSTAYIKAMARGLAAPVAELKVGEAV